MVGDIRAEPDVIVVRADEHVLALELWIAPRNDRDDVAGQSVAQRTSRYR